jgi:hypothetical protein
MGAPMKKFFLTLLVLGVLCSAALAVLWFVVGPPAEAVHIVINDQEVNVSDLSSWHAAAGGLGAVLAVCIVAVVLPLALLFGLLLPLLAVLGLVLAIVAAALGIGTLALSPLVLPLLLLWWLWRRSQRVAPAAHSRTIGE